MEIKSMIFGCQQWFWGTYMPTVGMGAVKRALSYCLGSTFFLV